MIGGAVPAQRIEVTFPSGGVECAADLYLSGDGTERAPCLVLGHGFSGTKGLARVYAERFAAAGFAVLVPVLVRLAAELVWPRRATVLAGALLALIGAGYVAQVISDQDGWRRSDEVQDEVLSAVRHSLPRPPADATIYTFGAPSFVAPGVPAFSLSFDLRAAVRLEYGDASLLAYPIRGRDVIRCGSDSLQPEGGTYSAVHGAAYGEAWFVNVPRRAAVRIDGAARCRTWARLLGAAA